MAKITRYSGNVQAFASNSQSDERTVFGELTQSDDLTDQITSDFLRGWGIVGPSDNPTREDFNALGYTLSQFIAYLHQRGGIPEYDSSQEYYIGSMAVDGGVLYISNAGVDGSPNVGNTPSNDDGTNWALPSSNRYISPSATEFVNSSPPASVDEAKIVSYHPNWEATIDGPKGGHHVHTTGATAAAPTAGSAVTAPKIGGVGDGSGIYTGDSAQAGYYWTQDGREWRIAEAVLYAEMFGAKNIGSFDSTAFVKDAVSAASSFGGMHIKFSDGEYLLSGPVDLNGVGISGESMFGTTILADPNTAIAGWQVGPGSNDVAMLYARNTNDWSVCNIGINCQDSYCAGVSAFGGSNIQFYNIYARNSANALLQFFGNLETGDPPVRDSSMQNCLVENSLWNLVVDGEAINVTISNNVSKDAVNRHISIDALESFDVRTTYGLLVANNVCIGHRSHPAAWSTNPSTDFFDGAINIKSNTFGVVSGNLVRGWGDSSASGTATGIRHSGSGALSVSDNLVHGTGFLDYGGQLADVGTDIVGNGEAWRNNTFFNTLSSAIHADGADTGQNIVLMGNVANGNTGGAAAAISVPGGTVPTAWYVNNNVYEGSEVP